MKSFFYSLSLVAMLAAAPLYLGSCTSSDDDSSGSGSGTAVAGGITASEFSSGTVSYSIYGASTFTVRPISSSGKVDALATEVIGVEGVLEIDELQIPVFYGYRTIGDLQSTGVLTGMITISLNGTEYLENSDLMRALGAPSDGSFMNATITVNYLAQTVVVESRVMQPVSIDPDAPGIGDLITGVTQPQTSFLDGLRFFYSEID